MPVLPKNAITKIIRSYDLRTPEAIARQGGTITGSPTYTRAGINLDGSNDYVAYAIRGELNQAKIKIIVDCTPDFNYDEDAVRTFFNSDGQAYYLKKLNNASSNVLELYLGGTQIAQIASAAYSAAWKQNERNVLSISSNGSSTDVWLNDTQILTADATAWSPASDAATLFVGAQSDGNNKFDGEIESVNIGYDVMTTQEHTDLVNNSTFNFLNKFNVYLDTKARVGKPSGTELATGDMDLGDWTAIDATLSNPVAGTLRLEPSAPPAGYAASRSILSTGKRYRVTGKANGDGDTAVPLMYLGATIVWTGTSSASEQNIDLIATSSGADLIIGSAVAAGYVEFQDLSVQEIYQWTEDKSGKGNDFLLADGTTSANFPSFSNPGFDFDGSTDYMSNPSATGVYNNASQTLVVCFKPDFAANENSTRYLLDSSNGSRYLIIKYNNASSNILEFYLGNTSIAQVALATYSPYWKVHGLNVLAITGTTGNTDAYLNGFKIVGADNTAWTPANPSSIYIGSNYTATQIFDGEMFTFGAAPIKITPTQVRYITDLLLNLYS